MAEVRYTCFDTSIGRCGVAWIAGAIVGLQLPEIDDAATEARMRREHPGAVAGDPDLLVVDAIERVAALLGGESADLDVIPVDFADATPFYRSVWEATRRIGRGDVLTYGDVARRIGDPGAAQAVGQALGANPIAIIVPCHRVVGANHSLVGFSANGGVETKRKILLIEESTAVSPSLFD